MLYNIEDQYCFEFKYKELLHLVQTLMKNNNSLLIALLSLLLCLPEVYCQTSGKIAGIGIGTFIIILAILFSIVWCLACRSSSRPELYSAVGVIVPVILILVFVFMPKEKDRVVVTTQTDMNFVTHVVFMVISILAFIISGTFLCIGFMFTEKKAKSIARSAFVMR